MKYMRILVVLTMLVLLGTAAMAADDNDVVTTTVTYVDLLTVPAAAALTLTATTAGATDYTEATQTQTDGLLYSHNSTNAKKITATAAKALDQVTNDVTLTAAIESGEVAADVVTAGVDQTAVLLWTGITAGGFTKDISWTANGSLAVTKAGAGIDDDLVWTVTFTSADA